MTDRLVLGCGAAGTAVVESMARWGGTLRVVVEEPRRAESFREESIDAVEGDPTDPTDFPSRADVVFVFGEAPGRNERAVETARETFPHAHIVGYAGGGDAAHRARIAEFTDRVIDLPSAMVDRIRDVAVGERAERTRRLLRVLRGIDGRLAGVTHDNPDPDAIGAALAVCRLAETVDLPADICYFGDISHQENRAMVNLLDLNLRQLDPDADVSEYGGVALVDHSRPGVNDGLPTDTAVDVVIDHHPPRAPVEASFVDLHHEVGATSTLLADYLDRLDVDPTRTVATAMLFGLRVDTNDFVREVSPQDFEAAAFLLAHADAALLDRVEDPSMSADVLDTLGRAIRNREVEGSALATCVGQIRDRDALAQAADKLLDMEGVSVTLVYGFTDDFVYASGRARGAAIDLGETLRDALGPMGSAGGHADMAGAQIPLGILADVGEASTEPLREVLEEVISGHFFETLDRAPSTLTASGDRSDIAFERPVDDAGDEVEETDEFEASDA